MIMTFENAAKGLEKERDKYLQYLKQIETEIANTDFEVLNSDIKDLEAKKSDLESELAALEEEERGLDEEQKELDVREKQLAQEEQDYWEKENDFEYKLKNHLENNAQMKNQWKSDFSGITKHYDFLKKLNVLNDVFNIEIEGEFGTISGFRLGTLGSKGNDVDADEINAACGQCVHLLSTIALKSEFIFSQIELKPMGNNSKITFVNDLDRKSIYSFQFQNKTSFNNAMQILVKAVNLICYHFKSKYDHLKDKVKLESYMQLQPENFKFISDRLEEWTNVCKYLLQNLKWLIYMSQVEDRIRQVHTV